MYVKTSHTYVCFVQDALLQKLLNDNYLTEEERLVQDFNLHLLFSKHFCFLFRGSRYHKAFNTFLYSFGL